VVTAKPGAEQLPEVRGLAAHPRKRLCVEGLQLDDDVLVGHGSTVERFGEELNT
jgi:hypothetical protein